VSRPSARFVAITGATASGKTDLSLALAGRMPVEIVSMDSRQVYRGMDIGTDKIDAARRARVPHHGLDLVSPDERYSAGRFGRDTRHRIDEIESRGALPVLVGGTGFFLRAVTDPIFAEPSLDRARLDQLRQWLATRPREDLERMVLALDPQRAPLAIEGGPQRMGRTIEVALLSGVPLSRWHRDAPPDALGIPGLIFVLELPRDEMDRRIEIRVQSMIDRGLEAEVRGLLEQGFSPSHPGMSGTGYREMVRYLSGASTLDEAMDEIRRNTRRYARRQITWFRHQLNSDAITVDAMRPIDEQVGQILNALRGE
jgi:tRNA dimethylallyltransferase